MEQSELFSTMFSIPQPTKGSSEEIEGSRAVHLTDSACDLHHPILRALYATRRNVVWALLKICADIL